MAEDLREERKAHLRAAIRRYLLRCPSAGDTPEGMLAHWLPRSGYEDAPNLITGVVESMVASAELELRTLPGGRVLYVRGPALS